MTLQSLLDRERLPTLRTFERFRGVRVVRAVAPRLGVFARVLDELLFLVKAMVTDGTFEVDPVQLGQVFDLCGG